MEGTGSAQTSYEEEKYCSVYMILDGLTANENILRLGHQGFQIPMVLSGLQQ